MDELEAQLREYVFMLGQENADDLLKIRTVYHHLKRMLGDEE